MEAAEVVFRSKKRKYCRNDEEMEPVLLGQEQVDRQDQQQLGPVAEGQGKKGTGDDRRRTHQGEVKRACLPQHGEAFCDLPRPGKAKINPSPSPEYWKEGEHRPPCG